MTSSYNLNGFDGVYCTKVRYMNSPETALYASPCAPGPDGVANTEAGKVLNLKMFACSLFLRWEMVPLGKRTIAASPRSSRKTAGKTAREQAQQKEFKISRKAEGIPSLEDLPLVYVPTCCVPSVYLLCLFNARLCVKHAVSVPHRVIDCSTMLVLALMLMLMRCIPSLPYNAVGSFTQSPRNFYIHVSVFVFWRARYSPNFEWCVLHYFIRHN